MSNSVEVRMPFLDNDLRLFSLALNGNNKFKDGLTKSILRESFKKYFTNSMLKQNFKQGLKSQTIQINDKTNKFIKEIINQKDFREMGIFKYKNIENDFKNNKNLFKIWNLCKYYLMIDGFKKEFKSIQNVKLDQSNIGNLLN